MGFEAPAQVTRILSVSRDAELARMLKRLFKSPGAEVIHESSLDHVLDRFKSGNFAILAVTATAYSGDDVNGERVLEIIEAKSPMTQVIYLDDMDDMETTVEALKAGAYQYSKYPVPGEELKLLIETALERRPHYGDNLLYEDERLPRKLDGLTGRSQPMQEVYTLVRQAAATDIPVLIYGETGTGKELLACAIHQLSARRDGPFLPAHLGALPEELVASELFGHEKGAFTGAAEQRKGTLELGRGGTVFLDEIGTINEKVQISLLRLLEQNKFQRLGGRNTVVSDIRLVAASNQDLLQEVRDGRFREDLYYRLDVFRITMPALRRRSSDIPLLVEEFLAQYARMLQKNVEDFSPDLLAALEGYDWPGNIRELKNVIQRAVLVCNGAVLEVEHLPERFRGPGRDSSITFAAGTPLAEVERRMILKALADCDNNRTRAAGMLGISRRALYNRLRKYSIP